MYMYNNTARFRRQTADVQDIEIFRQRYKHVMFTIPVMIFSGVGFRGFYNTDIKLYPRVSHKGVVRAGIWSRLSENNMSLYCV
jgi:hypothetical protein